MMEEITLRFEIIRLAVELGDYETIDLQCGKLRSLSLDDRLNEIIDLLESKNFRQALFEMKHYHRSLEDEFFENTTKKKSEKKRKTPGKEQRDWYEEGLFAMEEEPEPEERLLDLDDILRMSVHKEAGEREENKEERQEREEASSPEKEELWEGAEQVGEVPEIPAAETSEEPSETEEEAGPLEEPVESEGFAPEVEEEIAAQELSEIESEATGVEIGEEEEAQGEAAEPEALEEPRSLQESFAVSEKEMEEEKPRKEPEVSAAPRRTEPPSASGSESYPPISYIGQKFRNMIHQFPPIERSEVLPPEVERLRKKIAEEGYTEEEIEQFLRYYQEYKSQGKRAEAAQVLLLAAATESKFAQFLLARELFRGEVIRQDHAESFTQINTLADQNFAEAICDLGQFYEYGVGIGKDREMALLLYEEAAELGVSRAQKHYERLKNSGGLMGMFKKVKVPLKLPKKS